MSASRSDRLPALSGGLLTNEECFMLLDIDIFSDNDLLKNLPTAEKSGASYYNGHDEASASLYPPSPAEAKPSPAELANDLLQQLEGQFKQENIFQNWSEEKVDLSMFDSIPHAERVEAIAPIAPGAVPVTIPYAQPEPTEQLLREFESVYGAVELTHLTPPQSPPGPASQLLASYAQQAHAHDWHAPPPHQLPQPDYSTFDAVDELVRQGAAQLPSPRACSTSPPSSPRSSTDEEWGASPRAKPYSRAAYDRRSRKKEQNKNAATRYRQKKKAEVEVLLSEEHALRQRHADLGDKCSDLQREIRYLKGLMRDLFKAKGLIK